MSLLFQGMISKELVRELSDEEFMLLMLSEGPLHVLPKEILMQVKSSPLQNAYGLYITLDAPDGLFIDEWRKYVKDNPPASGPVEVTIKYQDKILEMTFEEFLQKLGLLEG